MSDDAAQNTDRVIWRAWEGDYYADSIHVTKEGAIGISCGGTVHVMPVRDWHKLATLRAALSPPADDITRDPFNRAVLGLDPVPPADDEISAIRARHEERMHFSTQPPPQIAADFATLLRAVDRLSAELAFYADPANHIGHRDPSASVYIETSAVEADGGDRARAAIRAMGGE